MGGPIAILTLICPNKEAGMANPGNTNKVRIVRIGILLPIVFRLLDFAEPIGAARIERRHVSRQNKVISRCFAESGHTCPPFADTARAALYTTNTATPAVNMAIVVTATTIHPRRELGWPCIIFLSEAIIRIATRRKGASNPLMTAVQ